MTAILFFGGLAALIFILWLLISLRRNKGFIIDKFIGGNIIVCGHKGKGKDLFFNYVINQRKNKCRANIQFNPQLCVKTPLNYLELRNNKGEQIKYSDFLNGSFDAVKKTLDESVDYYISDAGVHLPSQCHNELAKLYPSLPITYGLSRHLAKMNIHANTQMFSRIWLQLREQCDGVFVLRKTIKIGGLFLTKMTYYDDFRRAEQNLRPFKSNRLLSSKENKALAEQFRATNGVIMDLFIIQRKSRVLYDTRDFHKTIYGEPAPVNTAKRGFPRLSLRPKKTIENTRFDESE